MTDPKEIFLYFYYQTTNHNKTDSYKSTAQNFGLGLAETKKKIKEGKEQTIQEVKTPYLAGEDISSIAGKYGFPSHVVTQWMNYRGVKRPKTEFCLNHPGRPRVPKRRYCLECCRRKQVEYVHKQRGVEKRNFKTKPKPLTDPKLIKIQERIKNIDFNKDWHPLTSGYGESITVKPKHANSLYKYNPLKTY